MKPIAFLVLLCALSAAALLQQNKPVPVGVRQGEQAVYQGEQGIPPPLYRPPGPNLQQMQRDAAELSNLARSVPPEVDALSKGVRAKDLGPKLKKIEKLSKHLRSELRNL